MLRCKDITELVTDYVERRMSFVERLRFQLHLGMCRHCREYLRQVRRTIRLAGALRPEDVPPEIRDELLRRFQSWRVRCP
jgi:predicted anti-sigma-YlaC factor YlaD